jgi:MFS family permease
MNATEISEPCRRHDVRLRQTLRNSHKEASVSAVMSATSDNFLNAFAVFLNASAMQLSLLAAIPQLIGATLQFVSVWITRFVSRQKLVVITASFQVIVVLGLAILAASLWQGGAAVATLIGLAVLYHVANFIIQPHWRAWMGGLVPPARRGNFFATRTKITMATSLGVFLGGGVLLTVCEHFHWVGFGFAMLFGAASLGRLFSAILFFKMHDPEPHPSMSEAQVIASTLKHCVLALKESNFRNYSFFVAGMQGMVAISAPFFAVHMLNNLHFSYLEFCLNNIASIATQFFTLNFWGKVSDKFGNHLVIVITSCVIPTLPLWWLISPNFYYLLGVQVLSGLAWSGFSLSSANYLYDIRPQRSNFAIYAALQAAIGAGLIFVGSLIGGWVAENTTLIFSILPFKLAYGVFAVFICSSILRILVALWFLPRLEEPRVRNRPQILTLVFRVARFNTISGLVIDWITVTKRPSAADSTPKDKEK